MQTTDVRIDPSPDSFETVLFTNFMKEDFVVEDNAMWNGKPYPVRGGETKAYPIFLANHLAKHLINKQIQLYDKPEQLMDEGLRNKYRDLIFSKKLDVSTGTPSVIADKKGPSYPINKTKPRVVAEIKGDELKDSQIPTVLNRAHRSVSDDIIPKVEFEANEKVPVSFEDLRSVK